MTGAINVMDENRRNSFPTRIEIDFVKNDHVRERMASDSGYSSAGDDIHHSPTTTEGARIKLTLI